MTTSIKLPRIATANEVVDRIWIGDAPPVGPAVQDEFNALVLCAYEYQPEASCFGDKVAVCHSPMEDNYSILLSANATTAITTAGQIIRWHKAGWKILVTCFAGLNRSSFAVAIALIIGPWKMNFDEAVEVIRMARGEFALTNPQFLRYLKTYHTKVSVRSK